MMYGNHIVKRRETRYEDKEIYKRHLGSCGCGIRLCRTCGDGAVISTPNKDDASKTDNGYFVTKTASGDTIKIKVDDKTVDVKIGETIQGSVLFCVFVTGIPEGKAVTVSAD